MKISELKGVGPKKELSLGKLGIFSQEDLLYFFPRTYEDRREISKIEDLKEGETALIKGFVVMIVKDKNRYKKQQRLRLLVEVEKERVEVVFFNAKFLLNKFEQGKEYFFFGKVKFNMGRAQLVHPDFSPVNENIAEIMPIYSLTEGISQKEMKSWQKIVQKIVNENLEYLPEYLIEKNNLCSIDFALRNIHFPKEAEDLKAAKYRLIFDELLILQLGLLMMKLPTDNGIKFGMKSVEEEYIKNMPYSLTKAQKKVVKEIIKDMESPKVMNRLLQGDVGSGKTAVAEIALFKAIKNSFQGAFMAPTDILVKQHYKGLKKAFEPYGIKVAYLSGSMGAKEKRITLEALKKGEIDVLVGTHAIIEPGVVFKKLGIVITDEQHRFGVNQRSRLKEKGENPDILVMTATPIPRTLAVVLYGDMDVSIIDELPPGRKEIKTKAVTDKARDKVYRFVEEELKAGRQGYVVAPLIEESETLNIKSAEAIYKELKESFSNYQVALIHGAMKQKEKDEIMEAFSAGEFSLLVATVVIEVGINVPNASVMIVENAERFGLAQLHQLRGRVGRGKYQSYCVLITEGKGEIAMERAKTMASTTDGFVIAEKDLELRGPGEIFGTRQHGILELRLADMVKHSHIMDKTRQEAIEIIKKDKNLKSMPLLKRRVEGLFGKDLNIKL